MPRCHSPKCVNRRGKCVRPNPWVEFVSRHKPRTRAEHSAHYASIRPVHEAAACVWHDQRRRGVSRQAREAIAGTLSRAIRSAVIEPRAKLRTRLVKGRRRELLVQGGEKLTKQLGLDKVGVQIDPDRLGDGIAGDVYLGVHTPTGKRVAVKVQSMRARPQEPDREVVDRQTFEREVAMQNRFHDKAGFFVPAVLRSYTFKNRYAVTVMDTIDGILEDGVQRADRKLLLYVARQVKRLVATLAKHGLLHGDLHTANMAFKLRRMGTELVPQVALIDFGRSASGVTDPDVFDFDRFWVWRSSRRVPAFNRALLSVGFPGSKAMVLATGQARPNAAALTHHKARVENVAQQVLLAQGSL